MYRLSVGFLRDGHRILLGREKAGCGIMDKGDGINLIDDRINSIGDRKTNTFCAECRINGTGVEIKSKGDGISQRDDRITGRAAAHPSSPVSTKKTHAETPHESF